MGTQDISEEGGKQSKLLTTRQVAEEYRISPRKLRRYLQRGAIAGADKDSQGHWQIPTDSLEDFISQIGVDQEGPIERLLDYWSLLKSRPSLRLVALGIGFFVFFATVIGFLVDFRELWGVFASDNSEVALPVDVPVLQTAVPVLPTSVEYFLANAQIRDFESVDLDGDSFDELIVIWHDFDLDKIRVGVFGYDADKGWQPFLLLHQIWDECPSTDIYYEGVVDLFHDNTRQIVLSSGCGTGTIMHYFEIYQFNQLGLMERIFPESDQEWTPEMIGLENSSQWIEIADEKLYIHTQYGLYHCTWENDFLSCEKYEIDLGPNLITVEYWVDEEGGIQVSQNSVTLEVGQYLNVRPRTPEDSRPSLYDGNGVLEMKADYFYAAQVGDNFVIIGHYGPSRTVEIMVIDPERSS